MSLLLRLPPALRREAYNHAAASAITRRHLTSSAHSDIAEDGVSINLATPTISKSLLTLSPAILNSYDISTPPSTTDLRHAGAFFTRLPPTLLFSAPYFRSFPPSPFSEVAFLGRSNVGKSSLLNALFGRPNEKPAHVSKRPGKTRTMNGYGIGGEGMVGAKGKSGEKVDAANASDPTWKRFGRGGLVIVDMPGYGSGSRETWGAEIMKYLQNRKQLRRTYVLVDTEHGLKASDISLLVYLRQEGVPHQIVLSKVDKLLYPEPKAPSPQKLHNRLLKLQDTCAELKEKLNEAAAGAGGRSAMHDLLCCSAEKSIDEKGRNRRIGIDELRWSVLTACGLENKPLSQSKIQKERNKGRVEGPAETAYASSAYMPMEL